MTGKVENVMSHARRPLFRFAGDESGTGSVTGLIISMVALTIGGTAVDYTSALNARAEAQVVADAAARAGAARLHQGEDAARSAALDIANAHRPGLLDSSDISFMHWPGSADEGANGTGPINAVAVQTRRDDRNANPVATHLLRLVGIDRLQVSTISVVASTGGYAHCSGGGFFASERSVGNSSNDYSDGFCLHGEEGVQFHNQNRFASGAQITMPDLADFQAHNNNPGAEGALRAYSHDFMLLDSIADMIATIREGTLEDAGLPSFVTLGPVYRDSIGPSDSILPDTLYVVSGDVSLRDPRIFQNMAIVAGGNITVDSNVDFDNVVLAAEGHVTFNSNIRIGGSEGEYCDRGVYGGYVLSQQGIVFNSNNTLRGVLMASGGDIVFNSNNTATDGIYAEAGGDIVYNSRQQLRGCQPGLKNELTGANAHQEKTLALVR